MSKRRLTFVLATALVSSAAAFLAPAAGAATSDPSSNFLATPSCPTAPVCLQQTVTYLDQARARLSQTPYLLPGDFPQLSPSEQAFVLTNLDRVLYGLTPITGLTSGLDQAAAAGVHLDSDPVVSDPAIMTMTSNWAGGYRNLPLAYGAWMYDDGPGGANVDCTTSGMTGCWGHRHNVLWSFGGSGPLAMGAAAGSDARGIAGYAMLIVQGDSSYRPDYVYTWNQAVAAGAGVGTAAPPSLPRASVSAKTVSVRVSRLRVRGHSVFARVTASDGVQSFCSLTRTGAWEKPRYARCGPQVVYRHRRRGTYWLRVRAGGHALIRRIRIR